MAKILVTGGSGFVGREVVRHLLGSGHSVRLVSRLCSTSNHHVELRQTEDLFSASDLELESLLVGIECVVHLGWYVEPSDYLSSDLNWQCLAGSIRLGLVAREMKVRHFVGIGTCIEYESTDDDRKVSTPLGPETTYGAAKASAYLALTEIFRNSGTRFAWCRLFFLHGGDQDSSRLVPQIRRSIAEGVIPVLGDPFEVRDYLHVSEASRRVVKVVDENLEGIFNVCSGKPLSVLELFEETAKQMNRLDLVELIRENPPVKTEAKSRRIVGEPSPELSGEQNPETS